MKRFREIRGPLTIGSYAMTCWWAVIAADSDTVLGWVGFGVVFVLLVGIHLIWTASYGDLQEARGAASEARFAHDRWKQLLDHLSETGQA